MILQFRGIDDLAHIPLSLATHPDSHRKTVCEAGAALP